MARPKIELDIATLEKLCSMQCTDVEIAAFLGVSERTIERRRKTKAFSEAMDRAKAKGRVSVRRNLFHLAEKGNVAAAIFLSKNLLGYRDVVAHTGSDGGNVKVDNVLEVRLIEAEDGKPK